jgi:hypothetical protein
MARLTRQTLNVFAGSASNQGTFGSAQAGTPAVSASPTTVQSLSAWAIGWLDAVIGGQKLPPLEEFQGVQFVHSYMSAYMFQEGVPEYDAGTTYYQYSIVKNPGTFQLYGAVFNGANLGQSLSNPTYWKLLIDLNNNASQPAYGVTTNVGNNYSVTTSPAITLVSEGQLLEIQFNAQNTGAITLNVGGTGGIGVLSRDGNALVSGEVIANRNYLLVNNGTNWIIVNSLYPQTSEGTTTNSGNTYSVTTTPAFGALKTGQILDIQFNAGNTGAITLNPNGIGNTTVVDQNGSAIVSGAIVANRIYPLVYNGTNLVMLRAPIDLTTDVTGVLPAAHLPAAFPVVTNAQAGSIVMGAITIQWGLVSGFVSGNIISFGTAFSAAPWFVGWTGQTGGSNYTTGTVPQAHLYTSTGFTLNNGTGGSSPINWIAIGPT